VNIVLHSVSLVIYILPEHDLYEAQGLKVIN